MVVMVIVVMIIMVMVVIIMVVVVMIVMVIIVVPMVVVMIVIAVDDDRAMIADMFVIVTPATGEGPRRNQTIRQRATDRN